MQMGFMSLKGHLKFLMGKKWELEQQYLGSELYYLSLIFYDLPRNRMTGEGYLAFQLLDEINKCNVFEKQSRIFF